MTITGLAHCSPGQVQKRLNQFPVCIEDSDVTAAIRAASHAQARRLIAIQWSVGLRILETLAIEARDPSLDTSRPAIGMRRSDGRKLGMVPVHQEMRTAVAARARATS